MAEKKKQTTHYKEDLKEPLLKALDKYVGIITSACKEVGISRKTYYTWLKEDPEFKKSVDEIMSDQVQVVESIFLQQVLSGDKSQVKFYLQNKHPSYQPRQTLSFNTDSVEAELDKVRELIESDEPEDDQE